MNRAPFAVRSGTTPISTFARSKTPASSHHVGPRGERLDVVDDLGPDHVGAGVELLLEACGVVRIGERHVGDPDQVARRDRRSRRRRASRPSSRRRRGQAHHLEHVEVLHGRRRRDGRRRASGHRRDTARSARPSAQPPSRSAVNASRFRSRTVSCSVGSTPARATNARRRRRRHVGGRGRVVGDVGGVDRADQGAGVVRHDGAVAAARRHDLARDARTRRAARSAASRPPAALTGRTPAVPRRPRCSRAASRPSSARPRPGTGVIAPATSAASSNFTSPTSPSAVRCTPTSITVAPGLIMSPPISCGTPAAATRMSARQRVRLRDRAS